MKKIIAFITILVSNNFYAAESNTAILSIIDLPTELTKDIIHFTLHMPAIKEEAAEYGVNFFENNETNNTFYNQYITLLCVNKEFYCLTKQWLFRYLNQVDYPKNLPIFLNNNLNNWSTLRADLNLTPKYNNDRLNNMLLALELPKHIRTINYPGFNYLPDNFIKVNKEKRTKEFNISVLNLIIWALQLIPTEHFDDPKTMQITYQQDCSELFTEQYIELAKKLGLNISLIAKQATFSLV